MSTISIAPAPTASEPTIAPAPAPYMESSAPSVTVDDATYVMNTFSTLLEGDLYDDELNGTLIVEMVILTDRFGLRFEDDYC
jgi:hypothetical protein